MVELYIFYFFAAIMLVSATTVITVRNPVHAALFLVLAFFASAAIWLLMRAEFLAIILILVYVGAVMVLFLFVVMMLDINLTRIREGFARFLPVGVIVAVLMAVAMGLVLKTVYLNPAYNRAVAEPAADYSNTRELGMALYTDYLYPFEISGAILLVAIIAAISLTLRKGKPNRTQDPSVQVNVKSRDRIRIVKMEAEKKA